MKTIWTPALALVTGSEIADAVLSYGLVLARARRLELVDIPVFVASGVIRRARFMVGWSAEPVVSTEVMPGVEELVEPVTVLDLLDRAAMVGIHRGQGFSREEVENLPGFDLDFYSD